MKQLLRKSVWYVLVQLLNHHHYCYDARSIIHFIHCSFVFIMPNSYYYIFSSSLCYGILLFRPRHLTNITYPFFSYSIRIEPFVFK